MRFHFQLVDLAASSGEKTDCRHEEALDNLLYLPLLIAPFVFFFIR